MHALRLALGALPEDARSEGVRQLLQALPKQEFQVDLHICSFGAHACTATLPSRRTAVQAATA